MKKLQPGNRQRVLIACSHPLFGQGLSRLLKSRRGEKVDIVGIVSNLEEAMAAIESLSPDLVIVDYDDQTLNREEFLARFVEGEKKMRVVLLSLSDGEGALVYDRRTMAASQIDDWLNEWQFSGEDELKNQWVDPSLHRRRVNMKHWIIASILVIFVTGLLIFGLGQARLLPEAASAQAEPIDRMFQLEFIVIAFLFALIIVLILYSVIVFRRKAGDTSDAAHIEGNTKLEVTWTVLPLITVLAFSYLGAQSLAETQRRDPKALEVNVIGSQWSWRFEYPQMGITSAELYLPVNRQAVLALSSIDVIHSFWVPEFRVKQDALPGGEDFVRDLRVTPTKIGEYTVRCAELCGLRHAYMESPVIVLAQADFDAWAASQMGLSTDPLERGQKWAKDYGCIACHSIDGSQGVGPTWKGVFEHEVVLEDGSSVLADEAYLIESIRNPGVKIVQGYQNLMPANVATSLTDAQVSDLIEYIKSLK